MHYLMLVITDANPDSPLDDSDIELWVKPLDDSGKRIMGDPLTPVAQSTVVKVRGGKVLTTRGPFAETSEVIVGFDVLNVESHEEAVEIASRHPMARNGQLELRALRDAD